MNPKSHCRRSNVSGVSDSLPVGNHGDWSNIPPALLEYIQEKLPLLDSFRCRSVCHNWRSTTTKSSQSPPMLMLDRKFSNLFSDEDYSGADGNSLFLNLAAAAPRERIPVTKIPPNLKHRPLGMFSGGWFVGVQAQWVWSDRPIVMFNPSSSQGTSTYLRFPLIEYPLSGRSPICGHKVVFWDNTILGGGGGGGGGRGTNYGMVMISGNPTRLYFAKPGDTKFSELEGQVIYGPRDQVDYDRHIIQDIICIKNIVYGVTLTGYIESWDCNFKSPRKNILSFQPERPEQDLSLRAHSAYLVEYQGEFLFVSHFSPQVGDNWDPRRLFGVYKLDFDLKRWVRVESLGDMVLILLCKNQTMTLSTKEFPNYEKNSIYYIEGYNRIYIFNLGDGSSRLA